MPRRRYAPHQFCAVVSGGPLIIVRLPQPTPRWKSVLRALTALMRKYGMRQKDATLDGIVPDCPDDDVLDDAATRAKLTSAFAGGPEFASFKLYDWRDGAFRLVRAASSA